MSFYSNYLFPRLLDAELSKPDIAELRSSLLAQAKGEVLELGFGTGLNLRHYTHSVARLTQVDVNPGMNDLAKKRIEASDIEVVSIVLSADSLPFPDKSFDTVVSTWTLCSIANVKTALKEVARVLKPDGHFLFLEHGLSENPTISKWQNRINSLNMIFTEGCHINRDIRSEISSALKIENCEMFEFKRYPRTHGSFYQGSAARYS